MALAAPIAMAAGFVGIDRDQRAPLEPQLLGVLTEITAELVPGNERLPYLGRADAAILVIVQIASAEADGGDFEQRLAAPPVPEVERRNPGVSRSVQKHRPAQTRLPPVATFLTAAHASFVQMYFCDVNYCVCDLSSVHGASANCSRAR